MTDSKKGSAIQMYQLHLSYDGKKYIVFRGNTPEYMPGEILCELERATEDYGWIIKHITECHTYSEPAIVENINKALGELDEIIDADYGVASGAVVMTELSLRARDIMTCPRIKGKRDLSGLFLPDESVVDSILLDTDFDVIGTENVGHVLLSGLVLMASYTDKFRQLTSLLLETLSKVPGKRDLSIAKCVIFESGPLIAAQNIEYRIMNIEDKISNVYGIKDLMSVFTFEVANCINNDVVMKTCNNCGKHFPIYGRSDTVYCTYPSPNKDGKTCREIGAQVARANKEKSDAATSEYRKKYMKLKMQVRRHPEEPEFKQFFDDFISAEKLWRRKLDDGTITEEVYIEFIHDYDGSKTTRPDILIQSDGGTIVVETKTRSSKRREGSE